MPLEQFLENITLEELEELRRLKELQNNSIRNYSFSKITFKELKSIVNLKRVYNNEIFLNWFNNKIVLEEETISFLKELIDDNIFLIHSYKEEDLKVKFLTPILNKIKFLDFKNNLRDFYNARLRYETDNFILNGETDFLLSKGLEEAEEPYFFIQEFKKGKTNSDPEPQLLAELISGVELNNWKTIKGAFIIGAIWNFVILEKVGKDKYHYFVSENFDSTKIYDLKGIYKNLMFVKNEITEMIQKENKEN